MPAQLWHVEPGAARLEMARFSAVVHPLDPDGGLADARIDGRRLSWFRPLCVELPRVTAKDPACAVEQYARGGDLVVAYADRPEPAMRAEIYWRAQSHALQGAIAVIELLASVQTSLLDSCPRLSTRSEVTAGDVFQLSDFERGTFAPVARQSDGSQTCGALNQPQCYLFRLAGGDFSYAEMVHPSDEAESGSPRLFVGKRSASGAQLQAFELRHHLFAERLEKGVILRARVLGVLLDRDGDQAAAARHYAAFLREELPLTT